MAAKDTEIEAVSVAETATEIETGIVAATETASTRQHNGPARNPT